jgi:Ca2+-binding EF-hand superfamily protein
MFDKDGSGMITPSEIKQVLTGGETKIPNAIIESII